MTDIVDGPTATKAAATAVAEVLAQYGLPEVERRQLAVTIVARVAPLLHAGWRAEEPAPVVLPAPTSDPAATTPVGISARQIADFEQSFGRLHPGTGRREPARETRREPDRARVPASVPVVAEGFEGRATILHAWRNRYVVLVPAVRRVRGRARAQRLADRALARAADAQLSLVEIRRLPELEDRS